MVLLQGAMGAGILLGGFFLIYMLIAVPTITYFVMKGFNKSATETGANKEKKPLSASILPFLVSVFISIILSVGLFFVLILLLGVLFPNALSDT
jgi:hypothetical protein